MSLLASRLVRTPAAAGVAAAAAATVAAAVAAAAAAAAQFSISSIPHTVWPPLQNLPAQKGNQPNDKS